MRTWEGWLFCATVIDLYSRRVIGWALAEHLRASLVGDALEMAVATRGGHVDGVIFHSDRGCQYTSAEFAQLCEQHNVVQSMGATGICWDNAAAESFFATLKRELVNRARVGDPRAGQAGDRPLDRRLVQPASAALLDRLPHPQREGERMAHC